MGVPHRLIAWPKNQATAGWDTPKSFYFFLCYKSFEYATVVPRSCYQWEFQDTGDSTSIKTVRKAAWQPRTKPAEERGPSACKNGHLIDFHNGAGLFCDIRGSWRGLRVQHCGKVVELLPEEPSVEAPDVLAPQQGRRTLRLSWDLPVPSLPSLFFLLLPPTPAPLGPLSPSLHLQSHPDTSSPSWNHHPPQPGARALHLLQLEDSM